MLRQLATAAFLIVSLGGVATAQALCYAADDAPACNDEIATEANLRRAVRVLAPWRRSCSAIEVSPREPHGTQSVAVWSQDPLTDAPDAPQAIGTWPAIAASSGQGASLSSPVAPVAGEPYWMVWGCTP